MKWLIQFLFNSSIGRKVTISITGLFLCTFLVIHLIGNLQLLTDDAGASFNAYAKFMTSNPLIKTVSWILYASILYHAIYGIIIALRNRAARSEGYAVKTGKTASFASKNMALLGSAIFIFVVIHMKSFWFEMKFGELSTTNDVADLYSLVNEAFHNPLYVGFYVLAMIALGLHLSHGFQSGFQTLGLNHKKYTPLVQKFGLGFAIIIPAAFAFIPVFMYLFR